MNYFECYFYNYELASVTFKTKSNKFEKLRWKVSPHGVVANVLDSDIGVSEFKL